MTPVGYFAAAGLMAVGGIKFISAKSHRNSNNKLEVAVNETLPVDDQVKFMALRCLAEPLPVSSRINPEKTCCFWRATVKKNKSYVDIGVGPIGSEKTDSGVIVTPKHREHTEIVGFPNPLSPICNIGKLTVHNLDLAKWEDGFQTQRTHTKPIAAAPLLRKMDLKPDLSADYYVIVIDQFMEPEFTVFGTVTRVENGYVIDSKVVTASTPEEYVTEARYQEDKSLRRGKLYALGGCIMGSATWTIVAQRDHFTKYWEIHRLSPWYSNIKITQYSRLTAGYAALIGSVYAFQKVFNYQTS